MEMEKDEETVEARFVTHLEEYRVPETPFRVLLKMGRYGLSGVINHLLGLDPPKPFDFLIGDEFLRTTVADFLKQKKLSTETSLTIEYVEAFKEPEREKEFKHEDWVSALATVGGYHLSGCYDSIARVWDAQKCVVACSGHSGAITGIAAVHTSTLDTANNPITPQHIQFVTSSKDHTLRIWSAGVDSHRNTHIGKEHEGSVECVTGTFGTSTIVCSGGWDKNIKLWDIPNNPQQEGEEEQQNNKKRKIAPPPITLRSKGTLTAHTQSVSAIQWTTNNSIISGSWDHSIRSWDIQDEVNTSVMHCGQVVYCLSYNNSLKLAASGHPDRSIKLWDLRSNDNELVLKNLSLHKGWVSAVAFHKSADNMLVSGSYDGTVKVWDLRSSIPLHTLQLDAKVLDVTWSKQGQQESIVAGGADNKITIWKLQ